MKVYISGKIGEEVISDATREKFAKAEKKLKEMGFTVFNPCNEAWQRELKRGYEENAFPHGIPANSIPFYEYVLLRDLMVLSLYDAIYMQKDWHLSPGAAAELSFATATSKKIFVESDFTEPEPLEPTLDENCGTCKNMYRDENECM